VLSKVLSFTQERVREPFPALRRTADLPDLEAHEAPDQKDFRPTCDDGMGDHSPIVTLSSF